MNRTIAFAVRPPMDERDIIAMITALEDAGITDYSDGQIPGIVHGNEKTSFELPVTHTINPTSYVPPGYEVTHQEEEEEEHVQPDFCVLTPRPSGGGWFVSVTTGTEDMTTIKEGKAATDTEIPGLLASWNYTPTRWKRHRFDRETYWTTFLNRKENV